MLDSYEDGCPQDPCIIEPEKSLIIEPQMKSSSGNLIKSTQLLPSGRSPTCYCNLEI